MRTDIDKKETTFQKIQEMRDEIRDVKASLEQISANQHSMNHNQINNIALSNLKSNFDAIQNSQKIAYDAA